MRSGPSATLKNVRVIDAFLRERADLPQKHENRLDIMLTRGPVAARQGRPCPNQVTSHLPLRRVRLPLTEYLIGRLCCHTISLRLQLDRRDSEERVLDQFADFRSFVFPKSAYQLFIRSQSIARSAHPLKRSALC